MTSPGISLIIPAFNASRYLREAIDSALNQTVPPRQIIVVDDESADATLEIARTYGDPVVVISQPHGGASAARNLGIAGADQPLIAFLDADDRLAPDKFERQLQALSNHPRAKICICRVCDFWSPEIPQNARKAANLTPQCRAGKVDSWLLRREVFDSVGTFNTSREFTFTDGSELYSRIESARIEIVRIDDVLVERRLHLSNMTSDSSAHLDGIMALMKRRLDLRRTA